MKSLHRQKTKVLFQKLTIQYKAIPYMELYKNTYKEIVF